MECDVVARVSVLSAALLEGGSLNDCEGRADIFLVPLVGLPVPVSAATVSGLGVAADA